MAGPVALSGAQRLPVRWAEQPIDLRLDPRAIRRHVFESQGIERAKLRRGIAPRERVGSNARFQCADGWPLFGAGRVCARLAKVSLGQEGQ